jgi:SAM-dependent methyltransferase
VNSQDENKLMRRVAGHHNYRLDGMGDLLTRCRDASVMDLGCSRGQVGHDFVLNGATTLHGCDIDEEAVKVARAWHVDFRAVSAQFEVCDLTQGPKAFTPFGNNQYDIVVMLATYHKIKRVMSADALSDLMRHIGGRTKKWFAWRGTSEKANENEGELVALDRDMKGVGLKRVHTSYLSMQLGVAAIWARV